MKIVTKDTRIKLDGQDYLLEAGDKISIMESNQKLISKDDKNDRVVEDLAGTLLAGDLWGNLWGDLVLDMDTGVVQAVVMKDSLNKEELKALSDDDWVVNVKVGRTNSGSDIFTIYFQLPSNYLEEIGYGVEQETPEE